MRNTFIYTLRALMREKQIIIWVFVFPLVLATIFVSMFSNIDKSYSFDPIPTAIVKDANYAAAPGFKEMITELSKSGKGQLLVVRSAATAGDARTLLEKGKVDGYIEVDASGVPQVYLTPKSDPLLGDLKQTILKSLVDNYLRASSTMRSIAAKDPSALRDPAVLASLYAQGDFTRPLQITAHKVADQVRYFYALFGFLSIMSANIALIAIVNAQPNLSALGARRTVGATSKARTVVATLGASWVLAFTGLMVSFIYMRAVLRVDFGGNDLACVGAFAVASLMAISLGTLIGALPKLSAGPKGGILTGLASLCSLFAGLYGTPSTQLADRTARAFPVAGLLNPARQVANLFYSLYYYDGYSHFFAGVGVLLAMSAVLIAVALFLVRRQQYASL